MAISSKFTKLLPTIIFVLVLVLTSVIILNYFKINMNDNTGFRVLNRTATIETLDNKKSCNNNKCKTCNGINCKLHEDNDENNEMVSNYFDNFL
tara:strand:+ start:1525 stop:1806 length:282 start_codon:yes stop_codon:yes gene_type:complete